MYGFTVRVRDGGFDDVVKRTTEALKEEGFGIPSRIDVRDTVKKKLGLDRAAYMILGACDPLMANHLIEEEPDIGLLLPCNVVVRQEDDGVVVGFMDPMPVLGLVGRPELDGMGREVRSRLERVRDALIA